MGDDTIQETRSMDGVVMVHGTIGAIVIRADLDTERLGKARNRAAHEAAQYGWRSDGSRESEKMWLHGKIGARLLQERRLQGTPGHPWAEHGFSDHFIDGEKLAFYSKYVDFEDLNRRISTIESQGQSANPVGRLRFTLGRRRLDGLHVERDMARDALRGICSKYGVDIDEYHRGDDLGDRVAALSEDFAKCAAMNRELQEIAIRTSPDFIDRQVSFTYRDADGDRNILPFVAAAQVTVLAERERVLGRDRDAMALQFG